MKSIIKLIISIGVCLFFAMAAFWICKHVFKVSGDSFFIGWLTCSVYFWIDNYLDIN